MRFNRAVFFNGYQGEIGKLDESQRVGLEALIGFIEADPHVRDLNHIAYMLATEYWEEAHKWRPIREIGRGRGRAYARGVQVRDERGVVSTQVYYGRGRVQLTWLENYRRATRELRVQYPEAVARFETRTGEKMDLALRPDQALDPELSYLIMSAGMRQGWFSKGNTLARWINASRVNFVGARRIINGTDHAVDIATYADRFVRVLRSALVGEEPAAAAPPLAAPPVPLTRAAAAAASTSLPLVASSTATGLAAWAPWLIAGGVLVVVLAALAVAGYVAYRALDDRGYFDR